MVPGTFEAYRRSVSLAPCCLALVVLLAACRGGDATLERTLRQEATATATATASPAPRRIAFDDGAAAATWLRGNLDRATTLTGFAISPDARVRRVADRAIPFGRAIDGRDAFYGYPIMQRHELAGPDRAALIAALLVSMERGSGRDGSPACFSPHHALHVVIADQSFGLLVCFECLQLEVWDHRGLLANVPIDASAAPLFERLLPVNRRPG